MVVAIMASFVYGIYGFQGTLGRDEGIYVYSGQQMADGVPPYVSVFDHKGPLSPMLCGFAVAFGRSIGMDDILACRAIFFGISVLSVVSVFVLSEKVFGSLRGAFFSALILCGFLGIWHTCCIRSTCEDSHGPFSGVSVIFITVRDLQARFDAADGERELSN